MPQALLAVITPASVRLTIRLRQTHPQMARILLNTGLSHLTDAEGMPASALHDLQTATAAGRFDIDPYVALACTGGSVLGLFQLLDARPAMDAGTATDQLAASLLRMFGLPAGEARRIATRPLPAIA